MKSFLKETNGFRYNEADQYFISPAISKGAFLPSEKVSC